MVNEPVTVKLLEQEETARKYCNGNLSKFLRELIQQHDLEQKKIIVENIRETRVNIFQLFCFLFLGITFFVFAANTMKPISEILLSSIFTFSGILLVIYAILRFKSISVFSVGGLIIL